MINADMSGISTMKEFQVEICRQQEEAHGKDYCAIHDAITKYMGDCDSYMELGVHVGGTASVGFLSKPKSVCLVDIDLSRYRKFLSKIAEKYCRENGISLMTQEMSSTSIGSINQTDMLVIDSYHHPKHMQEELNIHGPHVKKYIIAHDTSIVNGKPNESLFQTLESYGNKHGFKVVERGITNVGYTVIKRVK